MITARQLHPLFGAEIDATLPNGGSLADVAPEIRNILNQYGIVVLREQHLTDDAVEAFGSRLGQVYRFNKMTTYRSDAGVFRVANTDTNGNILPADDRIRAVTIANQLWHTDSTYIRPRAEFSLLLARTIPPTGGETEFCDTRVAYEATAESRRRQLDTLTAHHSLLHSRALTGFRDWSAEDLQKYAPVQRPLVHVHEETSRKALYIASHICGIEGYSPQEAQSIVDTLIEDATRSERVYSHRWRVGDLVIWDNRCPMHRARPYDDVAERREMISLRTVDTADG